MTLSTDAKLLHDLVNDLDADHLEDDQATNLICLAMIREARSNLSHVEKALEDQIAKGFDGKRVTVDGVGTFEKHGKRDRKSWDRDALLRSVLDTRRVDTDTGEITDETPLDKVLHVWNLGTPRLTALKDRGLDPDEFCESEFAGFTIQLITN